MDAAQAKKSIRMYADICEDDLHEMSPARQDKLKSELQGFLRALDEKTRDEVQQQYAQWAQQKQDAFQRDASLLLTLHQLSEFGTPRNDSKSSLSFVRGYVEAGLEHRAQQFQNATDFYVLLAKAAFALRHPPSTKR